MNPNHVGIVFTITVVITFTTFSTGVFQYSQLDVTGKICGKGTMLYEEKNICLPIKNYDEWVIQVDEEEQEKRKLEVTEMRTLIDKGEITGYCYLFKNGEEICTPQK